MKAIREFDFNFVPRLSLGFTCLDPERLLPLSRPWDTQTLHGPCPSFSGGLSLPHPWSRAPNCPAQGNTPYTREAVQQVPVSTSGSAGWSLDLYHGLVSGPDLPEKVDIKKLILIYAQASLVHFGYINGTHLLKLHPSHNNFFSLNCCFH